MGERKIPRLVKLDPADDARLLRELGPLEGWSERLRRIVKLAFTVYPEGTLLRAALFPQDFLGNSGKPVGVAGTASAGTGFSPSVKKRASASSALAGTGFNPSVKDPRTRAASTLTASGGAVDPSAVNSSSLSPTSADAPEPCAEPVPAAASSHPPVGLKRPVQRLPHRATSRRRAGVARVSLRQALRALWPAWRLPLPPLPAPPARSVADTAAAFAATASASSCAFTSLPCVRPQWSQFTPGGGR